MLREIREVGFEYAELSHGIRISLLPGILDAVAAGEIRISTVHNFCPLPIGVNHAAPNLFKFSASDSRERDNAYRYSLKSLETAERVGAQLVVLHFGCIDMKDYTEKLIDLLGEGQKDSLKYRKLCEEVEAKREQKKEKPYQLARDMLLRLAEQAAARGIKLGIENRERLEEIPFESDLTLFFRELDNPAIVYWHDTGHGQIKENLGFIHHAMHVESLADRLAGFHIHDVRFPARDHLPPGSGMVDFSALKNQVKPGHLKVFELGPGVPVEELQKGVAYLKNLWGEV